MGESEILGLRILIEMPHGDGDYYIKYEFVGPNWKTQAIKILPHFLGQKDVKIQTLHPFTRSYNIQTGKTEEPGSLWLDNFYIKVDDLY